MKPRPVKQLLANLLELQANGGTPAHEDLDEVYQAARRPLAEADAYAREVVLGNSPQFAGLRASLTHLGRAWCSAIATPQQKARVGLEATRQLLAVGHVLEASRCLARVVKLRAPPGGETGLRLRALHGLLQVELGQAQLAASHAARILDEFAAIEGRLQYRDRLWLLSDIGQTLLAVHLRSTQRAVGLGSRLAAADCESETAQQGLIRWRGVVPDRDAGDLDTEFWALAALAGAATAPQAAGSTAELARMVVRFESEGRPITAQTWSWLGSACRLAGSLEASRRCHDAALSAAARTEQVRAAWMSGAEFAWTCAAMGEMTEAYRTLEQLRTAEQLLGANWPHAMGSTWHLEMKGLPAPGAPAQVLTAAAAHVGRARQAIHAGCRNKANIMDVAAACGVSRRTLEMAFREHLGTSVRSYISAARVAAVRQALESSAAPTKVIAEEFGYASAASMCRQFKRETGVSIKHYLRSLDSARQLRAQKDLPA